MERAARLFKNKSVNREIMSDEDVFRAAWPLAVGKAIARHTSHVKLVRDKLVVQVEDAIWQRQLHTLSFQILDRLRKVTGNALVTQLEFRIAIPRRTVQRAESIEVSSGGSVARPGADEAETILDPVLKKVYRLSRKKASA
jgi:predicted nucleic acid-binding Zn ribbon protein